ncbi:PTS system IIB component (Glc family) /PTS system IIC component (Glc family) [Kineothrix alysoides]|uniref:PTS system IIB component (Glc family) /PTS system IIC component (Glc family) n=1 Tax=Kineothrix alysoides TaxID=1469948 RepID=A0A4R1QTM5_9FIRM|nr:PTS transporter subunit EIIC [Kineothrix alysoides]TCL57299.1 PTS system IIB component (Glc family) /PTS system IIC component (Glc family) [Kineothrix alysoides]
MKNKLNLRGKLQTFSGAMMVPVILLVIVGFYVGIGSAFTNYIIPKGNIIYTIFDMFSGIGFMIMRYLPLWFAVGIAFTLSKKEKGWGALAGLFLLFAFNKCISVYAGSMGWDETTTTVDNLLALGYTQTAALNFNSMWASVAGIFTFDMGIFSGLICGLVAAWANNKWNEKELPMMFSFFSGTKFVILMLSLISVPMAIIAYYVWPVVADGLHFLTNFITSSGLTGTFVFGTLDKLLLPFGIHHLIAFPIEYTRVGGTMTIDGTLFEGVKNIIVGQSGSADATGYIVRNFTSGRVLFQLAGLPAVGCAIYATARKENKKKVLSIVLPAVVTMMMVGISEPIEYTFLFVAPVLYFAVYAPICGLTYVLTEITQVSINGNALLFMIPNLLQPQKVHAMSLLYLLPLTFAVYFFLFRFLIVKFNLKTPGREAAEQEIKFMSKKEYNEIKNTNKAVEDKEPNDSKSLPERIVDAFGGAQNIVEVSCCATRLRVTVKDQESVADDKTWKNDLEALGVVKNNKYYQIIYGTHVTTLTTKVKDVLEKN